MEATALSALRVGLPMMALYAEGRWTTKKLMTLLTLRGSFPKATGRSIDPSGSVTLPVKLMSRVLTGFSFS